MNHTAARIDHHGTGVRRTTQRFPASKRSGTGVDPLGSFMEFLRKDVKQNIDLHRDTVKRLEDFNSRKDCPAIGCTKKTRGCSLSRVEGETARFVSETDHISFRLPERHTSLDRRPMPHFGKSQETKEGWAPRQEMKTLSNRQSTTYNPITFQEDPHAVLRKAANADARRTKGITEFADKQHLFSVNTSFEHREALQSDPRSFYRKTGIFSHMYDDSARNGYMTMPFEKSPDLRGKPAFKCC